MAIARWLTQVCLHTPGLNYSPISFFAPLKKTLLPTLLALIALYRAQKLPPFSIRFFVFFMMLKQ